MRIKSDIRWKMPRVKCSDQTVRFQVIIIMCYFSYPEVPRYWEYDHPGYRVESCRVTKHLSSIGTAKSQISKRPFAIHRKPKPSTGKMFCANIFSAPQFQFSEALCGGCGWLFLNSQDMSQVGGMHLFGKCQDPPSCFNPQLFVLHSVDTVFFLLFLFNGQERGLNCTFTLMMCVYLCVCVCQSLSCV